jgi:hypothetical protein
MNWKAHSESGQTTVEYLLLISILIAVFGAFWSGWNRLGVGQKLQEKLLKPYAAAYQYGHPKAKGPEQGGPLNHPSYGGSEGNNNGRMFISPRN